MRVFVAVLAALFVAPVAQACINSKATDQQGRAFHLQGMVGEEQLEWMSEPFAERRSGDWDATIVADARKEPNRFNLNELAVLLIRQGKYDAAIRLLVEIERLYPGESETAANLGTALELAGHDAIALRWIRLGMRRNPKEHYSTEWLHMRILEAKVGKRDIASISGVTFSNDVVPKVPTPTATGNIGNALLPKEVAFALEHQLYERMGFVQSKDAIVARLLADWATLHLAGGSVETALAAYKAAQRYGYVPDALALKRIAFARDTLAHARSKPVSWDACPICQP